MLNKISSKNLIRGSLLITFILGGEGEIVDTLRANNFNNHKGIEINEGKNNNEFFTNLGDNYDNQDTGNLNIMGGPGDRLKKMMEYADSNKQKEIKRLIEASIKSDADEFRRTAITLDELYADTTLNEESKFAIGVALLGRGNMRERAKGVILANGVKGKYSYYLNRIIDIKLAEQDETLKKQDETLKKQDETLKKQDETIKQQEFEMKLLENLMEGFGIDIDTNTVKKK